MNVHALSLRAVLALAAVLIALLGLARPALAGDAWRLVIKPAACASGQRVLLAEIAVPDPDVPAAAWAALAPTPLWDAPEAVGRQTVIPARQALEALRHYLRDAPVEYVLPAQLAVQRGGKALYRADIEALAEAFLAPRLAELSGEVGLGAVEAPEYVFLDDVGSEPTVEAAGPFRPGRVALRLVGGAADGRTVKKVPFSAVIDQWREIPVTTRPLGPRDGLLTESSWRLERVNLGALKAEPWDGRGGPWRVRQSVGQHQVLLLENLEPMPHVLKGEKVNLIYEGARVRLSASGEATVDGAIGQPITVRNLHSKREIVGFVRDKTTVVVKEQAR